MKKTTKKTPKASHKKAVKNLDVKPAKGGTVRGGKLQIGNVVDRHSCKL